MEPWQIEALGALLETETKEVEAGQRVYTSSETYGSSRYHLIERRYDGVQLEQIEVEEKWSKRVSLCSDELPAVLKTLLLWHLEEVRRRSEATVVPAYLDDGLGDVDEHPF